MVDNMEWFNVFGLIFIAVIMIPNVVFAIKCKDGFDNKEFLTGLFHAMYDELPDPKPKKKK